MGAPLKSLTVRGFKSIRNLEKFELGNLNVLIGANGAGKSNFLEIFNVLSAMTREDGLKEYVAGTADSFLFGGSKITKKIYIQTRFGVNGYDFELVPTNDGFFLIQNEITRYFTESGTISELIGSNSFSSGLLKIRNWPGRFSKHGVAWYVDRSIKSWKKYHFHDTSAESGMRRYCDNLTFRVLDSRGDRIAAFLYYLKTEYNDVYQEIVHYVRLATPFFQDFVLEPNANDQIRLNWTQKGLAEYPLKPYSFSDGTLRFICLATALLQPNLPTTLVIDEPELGLHPEAIGLLAELLHSAAQRTQIIVATQSATFLDYFKPENVIVAKRRNGESTFERLDQTELDVWLEDYTLGDLWRKNVVEGGTVYER